MLVLSRKNGESILIGGDIRITVVKTRSGAVRLGVDAPSGVRILREELYEDDAGVDRATDHEDHHLQDSSRV